ncbi:MAG: hypothetical protein K0Q89_2288, partial [Thermomicrobiales bacterium]|nr:hypothetical protein [Thermomicrobiales bacterium]
MIDAPDSVLGHRLGFLNERAHIACLVCAQEALGPALFSGCTVCGVAAPLTLVYKPAPRTDLGLAEASTEARQHFAPFAPTAGAFSRPPTPLDPAPRLGRSVYLKNETFSLTGSHKDRYNVVAARVARLLGSRGIVASSTGNHGVSAAAQAAAAGLPSVVFCHPEA